MRARWNLFLMSFSVFLVTILAGGTVAAQAAPNTPNSKASSYRHYVALGDSYTSGPLIPIQRIDPVGCLRSTENYPSILARKIKPKTFTDVSCAGADTTNMAKPQSVLLGPNPPQLNALSPDTDLVTIGIGGNDYEVFGRVIDTCPDLRDSDPTGNPCQRHFTDDGVDKIKADLPKIQANISKVLRQVHQRSPEATVLIIGYPRIAPAEGTCPNILPFADGDYAWLNSVEEGLNSAIAKAAANDGNTTYVDTFGPSRGHDACAPNGAAWINGQHRNLLAAADYHPFRTGMVGVANVISKKLK